jgi:rRNA biogenesis protein RRP5
MGKRKTGSGTENNASTVTIAASTEENFPRGGASTLTPLEHREISNKVAKDLFDAVRFEYSKQSTTTNIV